MLPLLCTLVAAPALACLPPPIALEEGEILAAEAGVSTRVLLGGDDGAAVQTVPLRHVVGSVDEAARLEAFRDDVPAGDADEPVTRTRLTDGGRNWAFVLAGGTLAVAQSAPEYRLRDAVTVQTDPGGSPSIGRAFVLAPGQPALLIVNAHFNSQEGFAQHSLLAYADELMDTVWEGPILYSLSTSDAACDLRRIEQTLAGFDVTPGAGPWPDIAVRYVETEFCEKDGHVVPSQPREFATVLRYDAATARYVGDLSELEALNAQRRGE